MTVDLQRLGVLRRQDLQRRIGFERTVQIPQIAVDLGDQGVIGQARADRARHVDGRRARGNTLDTSIRKGDLKITHRYLSGYQTNPSGPVWTGFLAPAKSCTTKRTQAVSNTFAL